MSSVVERERKFLVNELDVVQGHTASRIEQVYLHVGEKAEWRIRRHPEAGLLIAIKSEPFLSRVETEFDPLSIYEMQIDERRKRIAEALATEDVERLEAELSSLLNQRDMAANLFEDTFTEIDHRIVKDRYHFPLDEDSFWEVDVFQGDNAGLVLAEIELPASDNSVLLPEWCGEEVTHINSFYNAQLAVRPINIWPSSELAEYGLSPAQR